MWQRKYQLILVGGLCAACLVAGSALAAKGGGGKGGGGSSEPGTFFEATFVGAELTGAGTSNETAYASNIANLVFNKRASGFWFDFTPMPCDGLYTEEESTYPTMHLLDTGSGFAADNVVARLWFQKGSCGNKACKYVLEVFEDLDEGNTEYGWDGGAFPPFDGGSITRSAGSWLIGANGGPAGPCVGQGGTFASPVLFTITPK